MNKKVNFAIVYAVLLFTAVLIADAMPQKDFADDPEAHPPLPKADVKIVQRAREILHDSSKWNRSDTRDCPDDAKTFSLYCSFEKASKEVTGRFQHRSAAMQEARFVIDEIAPNRKKYEHRLMDYNNNPSTAFRDIQRVFGLMEDHITKRLKEESPRTNH